MDYTAVRLRLPNDLFRKYKVFCAINNLTMTQQTQHLVREFIEVQNKEIKIVNLNKTEGK
jgi:hypothetical protein